LKLTTNVASVERRAASKRLSATRETVGKSSAVEIAFDSTRFATQDIGVHIRFSPDRGVAAYLSPVVNRNTHWRDAPAGASVEDTCLERFKQHGFRSKGKMASLERVRVLAHLLQVGLGKSLDDFVLASGLSPMPHGGSREWDPLAGRWLRSRLGGASASGSAEGSVVGGTPELPSMSVGRLPVVVLTMDQKQSQCSAAHFLADPGGVGLSVAFRGDMHHPSWRDF
jgi:hypothetical protein